MVKARKIKICVFIVIFLIWLVLSFLLKVIVLVDLIECFVSVLKSAAFSLYVHNSLAPPPKKKKEKQIYQNIDNFGQNSQGIKNSQKLYKHNPLENFVMFTIYQNYSLALTTCKWVRLSL